MLLAYSCPPSCPARALGPVVCCFAVGMCLCGIRDELQVGSVHTAAGQIFTSCNDADDVLGPELHFIAGSLVLLGQ